MTRLGSYLSIGSQKDPLIPSPFGWDRILRITTRRTYVYFEVAGTQGASAETGDAIDLFDTSGSDPDGSSEATGRHPRASTSCGN